jgi:hypothetical protein
LLAGQRAQEPIAVLNTSDAPLHVSVDSENEIASRLKREQPIMIQIAPAAGDASSVLTLRASASFDASRRRLIFACHKLEPGLQDDLPVIVSLPTSRQKEKMSIKFSFRETALRVGQLLELQRASAETATDGELEVEICVHGVGPLGTMQHDAANPFQFPEVLPTEGLVALAEIDRQMPIPCFAMRGLPERLTEANPKERASEFEIVKKEVAEHKPSVTSITLRFASVAGQDVREEYLGCLPIGCHFPAPRVSGGSMSQQEIDQKWSSGEEDWKVTALFREDCYTLAAEIRNWVKDPTRPFPFGCDNSQQFHYCKTRLEQEHLRHIDRFWYVERPVVFRFCPATKSERYRIELEYWRSVNDDRRVDLLAELIAEEESRESAAKQKPSPIALEPEKQAPRDEAHSRSDDATGN